ncbi:von Willebrand factor A domain-containing protein 7 [Hyalella azteca]|uniref:von Willebrand factor A domain-containing protein 7 n=1 Tax=Hyalella azteca TaxID=294128 RepID=A0A8B7NCI7_HYAAZ|nr:von Willebrand factor A domain-containing protein 7 [Hyalella azteca]
MTLEEAYRAYHDPNVPTKRLLLALQDIADAAADTHVGGMGAQPMYHFNNEQFAASHAVLQARWGRLVGALKTREVAAARYLLGTSLAALQDFYSHSNWIELGHDSILEGLGLPSGTLPDVARFDEETCVTCLNNGVDCKSHLTDSILASGLLTSEYVTNMGYTPLPGKCQLPPRQARRGRKVVGGISKDLPSACFSPRPDLHNRAALLAAQATAHYLTALRQAVGNELFHHLLSLHPRPAVAIVTDGRKDFTETLLNSLPFGTLGLSEPEEYLLVFYSNTLRGGGGVFRSGSATALVQALKSSLVDDSAAALRDPLAGLHTAAHAALPDTEVFMLTESAPLGGNTGANMPLHTRELLLRKRIKVMPLVVGHILQKDETAQNQSSKTNSSYDTWIWGNVSAIPLEPEPAEGEQELLSASRVYQILAEFALVTGGHVIDVPTATDLRSALAAVKQQYFQGEVVLYRDISGSSAKIINITVDNRVQAVGISLYGTFVSATMTADGGSITDLLGAPPTTTRNPYRVNQVPVTPDIMKYKVGRTFMLVRSALAKKIKYLTLTYLPSGVASVIVTASSAADIIPSFYHADVNSSYPSLQRLSHPSSSGMHEYLGVSVPGIDTASLQRVISVELTPLASPDSRSLKLPTTSPRFITYARLNDSSTLPLLPFSVVYKAQDSEGRDLVRMSQQIQLPCEFRVCLGSGREVWGSRGTKLSVHFSLTNTAETDETFTINAADSLGYPIVLSRKSVRVVSKKSVNLVLFVHLPTRVNAFQQLVNHTEHRTYDISSIKSVSNSLVITATSPKGQYSSVVAYVIDTSDVEDGEMFVTRNVTHL